jgi:hypothetical protein
MHGPMERKMLGKDQALYRMVITFREGLATFESAGTADVLIRQARLRLANSRTIDSEVLLPQ